ncbi:glycosyl transferase [Marivirga tractuosa]|uniref:Glycosyl transferase family 2 n=1 Tax=Marivirga tractuosa (strain ATCC 23168 / DSM 4126 / NBRC 15989 / NCIMB 1408 / VKM B-1430 / H-43) TaxID=643867 RepID=E4TQB2_MARTH|nr:glycosyltransferase [Marivirga tractuosa]ADR22635.1 glycosyl transferase family 2 [Marivirga tractuosa DSM 4126]BDD16694.1 glycosyl transferase [Marivirga tractuosa]
MAESNRVLVLICLYKNDKEKYFSKALESILNQTYPNFTIFLNIDGAIDKSIEDYLRKYIGDKRIIINSNLINRGLPHRLNEGINYAIENNYDLVARMDSDDISFLNRFQLQVDFLKSNNHVDIIGGQAKTISDEGNIIGDLSLPLKHDKLKRQFIFRSPLIHPAVMARTDFFKKAGYYSEHFRQGQDYELWFRALKNNCIFNNLPNKIIYHRIDESFFSGRRSSKTRAKNLFLLRRKAIRELDLSAFNYLIAFLIYVYAFLPSFLKRIAYNKFR